LCQDFAKIFIFFCGLLVFVTNKNKYFKWLLTFTNLYLIVVEKNRLIKNYLFW
jgi:hypothetical protein